MTEYVSVPKSSRPGVFWKKKVFLKKTAAQMFSCEFCKIFKNTFFRNLRTTTFELLLQYFKILLLPCLRSQSINKFLTYKGYLTSIKAIEKLKIISLALLPQVETVLKMLKHFYRFQDRVLIFSSPWTYLSIEFILCSK